MNKKCKKCNSEFTAPDDPVLNRFTPFCPVCATAQLETDAAVERKRLDHEREIQWQSLCPPAFRDTVVEKLPNPARAAEILSWNYGKTGLLLHGRTRTGKSRCAWLLVRKVFELDKSIQVLDSMAGFQYAAAFSNSGREAQAWVEARCRCGLLFFDDVFKVKLTDSFEAAVFAIVDYRLNHHLPILATLNDTGETLAARMSSDRGDAFVARLKETCGLIQF
jgi:DNA replication protein DnaC